MVVIGLGLAGRDLFQIGKGLCCTLCSQSQNLQVSINI